MRAAFLALLATGMGAARTIRTRSTACPTGTHHYQGGVISQQRPRRRARTSPIQRSAWDRPGRRNCPHPTCARTLPPTLRPSANSTSARTRSWAPCPRPPTSRPFPAIRWRVASPPRSRRPTVRPRQPGRHRPWTGHPEGRARHVHPARARA
ncbi:hypothetical protein RAA17_23265 [Komagataeibacter rhaeticus]|nr:hypothetical protein [Komagataeibacter rhaeticus]